MSGKQGLSGSSQSVVRSVIALGVLSLSAAPLSGQTVTRDPSVADLPRKGYEPRTIRVGAVVIQPSVDAALTYDDNIFASPNGIVGDEIIALSPRIDVRRQGVDLDFSAEVHADLIRYNANSKENVNLFGGVLETRARLSKRHSLNASMSFDRGFERRSDPEATVNRALPPTLTNISTVNVKYRADGARFGAVVDVLASQLDYLSRQEDDRDLRTYRLSVRALLNFDRRIALFIEPYVNRRDARRRLDRNGLDQDSTTTGLLGGVSFDIGDKLQGDAGIGVFRAQPEAAPLRAYSGLAANGRIVWRPRRRTAIVIAGFRGDVATVRAGALGRIDTRLTISIEQEARHNLLLHGSVGVHNVHYRGTLNRDQRFVNAEIEARYLVNRHLSFSLAAAHTRRSADDPGERFRRWRTTFAARLVY